MTAVQKTIGFGSSTGVSDSSMGRRRNKKKGGVNNKVHIPEFDGKTSNTEGTGEAFQSMVSKHLLL